MFEVLTSDAGLFELNGERRVCLMATRPNRESSLAWRKSRNSGASGGCVEIALSESSVLVRDSRDQLGTILTVGPVQWRTFVRRVREGRIPPG
jgi:hypothetical protein